MKSLYRAAWLSVWFAVNSFANGTGQLPWEEPFEMIVDSVTGPVAVGATVIGTGMAAVGWIMHNHGEVGHFGQMASKAAIGGGMACLAAPMVTALFGVTGCLV